MRYYRLDEGALKADLVLGSAALVQVAFGLLAVIAAHRGLLAPGLASQQAAQLVAAEVGRHRREIGAIVVREPDPTQR